ncbi:lysosomal alpha-glucosidase-like isoform X2 [Dreissena polymorpha]|uniref:lysosomal alpha-glucosidase-like isoform X2 n=1 Tax=Dreissena polymorpha TaxID=45954 RepID=UPI0022640F76|nr:lysosomal alpha-glucosidase-like isoform X2 [Dreissena polymorpha]
MFANDKKHLIDNSIDGFHTESRSAWKKNGRNNFIKTLLTICIASCLGALGTWFALGYWDIQDQKTHTDLPSTVTAQPHVQQTGQTIKQAPQCSQTPASSRVDCWPQYVGANQQTCEEKGCCWLPAGTSTRRLGDVPYCFYPSNYQGYKVDSVTKTASGYQATLHLSGPSTWPNDVQNVNVDVTFQSPTTVRVKIYDPATQRYEVPIKTNATKTPGMTDYDVAISPQGTDFTITITRKSTGTVIFSNANSAPLVFADQFLQFGTQLSSAYLYGLGEHRAPFLISTNWSKRGFWSRDQPPTLDANLYGVHPFYLNVEDHKNTHGVFLVNSNAMEIEVSPQPALAYRTTGGILDFYIFTGPSPDSVIQQYTGLIGRPFMPPYWALGFHLCRWGYGGVDPLKAVIKRMRDAKMPYDTQWNDIDYMRDHLDWTYDADGKYKGLPDVVADLHNNGQHYIMIIDPGISNSQPAGSYPPYDDGLKKGIFIMNTDDSGPIIGKVWPGTTAFPDFFHPNATAYWTYHANSYHNIVPFDGIWIDMNEPSNFVQGSTSGCPKNDLENPPFVPPVILGQSLSDKTLCASAKQAISTHYNLHSLYGHSEAIATKMALDSIKQKRSIVISRSTYPTSGVHTGHWLGDNNAQWPDMYYSIPGILNFNLFGIPFVGADICGFMGETTPELCTRWMQLGAFYPFMRNHNMLLTRDQDPASFDTTTQNIMRDALNLRYTLLPYLYTLFYISHVYGTPVVRPIFFSYPESENNVTYSVDTQFMWGDSLLITPTTSQNTLKGQGYLPKDRWYDWFNHSYIDSTGYLGDFDLPMEHINLQVRGGSIIPLQAPEVTTTLSRKNPFSLLATLTPGGASQGMLYWDDGESLDSITSSAYNLIYFRIVKHVLTSTVALPGYHGEAMTLGQVTVLGVEIAPTSVTINGQVKTTDYNYSNKALQIYNLSLDLLKPININWTV